jgi:hypothetical protein
MFHVPHFLCNMGRFVSFVIEWGSGAGFPQVTFPPLFRPFSFWSSPLIAVGNRTKNLLKIVGAKSTEKRTEKMCNCCEKNVDFLRKLA